MSLVKKKNNEQSKNEVEVVEINRGKIFFKTTYP